MTETELHDNLFPDDGYRATVVDNRPVALAVYVEAVAQGRSAAAAIPELAPVLAHEARGGDDRSFGAASRAENLLDAVCRFFNTGGTQAELLDLLKRAGTLLRAPLTLPDGYYLLETYLNTDNVHEHVFVSDERDDAVLWAEGSFVGLVPWETLLERLADNGRLASASFLETLLARRALDRPDAGADALAGAEEGAADLAELPGGEDPPGA